MPRVLITGFCSVPGPRRAGVQLRHVIRSLTPFHNVDLLVVREGEQAYVERQGSVRMLRVPHHDEDLKAQIQAFRRALKRQLDGADYDVVHCRDAWSGITVLEARARLGYAVVYDLSRSPLGESVLDSALDAQYARDEEACIRAADVVLAPTQAAVDVLKERAAPDRVVLSPPGVDVDRFDWDEPAKSGPARILYAGSIDPGRGVRVLVRAMVTIAREVDARLVLAGSFVSPKFETALRDGMRELGIADKVDVLGPVEHDQLPALIATATVCVVPAAADLTPNPTILYPTKLLEYMACKRGIVAPKRETVSMIVENGREALLFEPGDPIDLAHKVLRLLGEPALRERLATAAYERVRREFTASGARRAVRNAYQALAERFADQFAAEAEDDGPKVELLADDDFEATVFEEAPRPPSLDTALNQIGADSSIDVDLTTGNTSSVSVVAPPPPPDETIERIGASQPRADTDGWTRSEVIPPPARHDEWLVTNVAEAVRALEEEALAEAAEQNGGPRHGPGLAAPTPLVSSENPFVAGEIDVPAPGKVPALERTPRSALAGGSETSEPDTGRSTPAAERRST